MVCSHFGTCFISTLHEINFNHNLLSMWKRYKRYSYRDKSDAVNNIAGRHYQHATIKRHRHRIIKLETFFLFPSLFNYFSSCFYLVYLFPAFYFCLAFFHISLPCWHMDNIHLFVNNFCFTHCYSFLPLEETSQFVAAETRPDIPKWMVIRNSDGNRQFSLSVW